jgi:hypothetical protein
MAIKQREDVNPERGEHEYGDVAFADPTNNKYPIDTADHVRAAWAYINKKSNADKYSRKDAEEIRNRIRHAAARFDIETDPEA